MFAQLAGDQKVGEWARDVLFKAVLSERPAEAHRTILGESLAPRKLLLLLQFTVASGLVLAGEEAAGARHGRNRIEFQSVSEASD